MYPYQGRPRRGGQRKQTYSRFLFFIDQTTKQYCQYYLVNTDQAVLTNTWSVLLGQKNTSAVTTTGAPTTQTPALTTTPPPAQFSCAHLCRKTQ